MGARGTADGPRGGNPNQPSRTAPKRQLRSRAPAKTASIASVQSDLSDESWIGPDLTSLDALDDVSQYCVGAASYSDLLALAHDQPIKKFDFRAPTLLHILAHRRPLFGRGALALPEALLIAGAQRRFIAFSRARKHLGGPVEDLIKLVAQRLPNTDRFAANARREMTERIIVQHRAAGQPGAGGDPICHRVGHQLRPALAPEISGHLGAICISD